MINKTIFSIFKNGSRTYFYSSLFFPSALKKEVFSLYGFVRKADNFVDSPPQDINGFYKFKDEYKKAEKGINTDDIVIDSFIKLSREKNFNPEWTDSFLKSMEMDITKNTYETIDETLQYIYGSAEVIGFYMSKIMNLPKEAYYYAKYLGRAMQYINCIRDISEDIRLDRTYFPQTELEEYGLKSLNYEHTIKNKENFTDFINKQLKRYIKWQQYAEEGYRYIPKRYLIPVKTASEIYNWTAEQIHKNPFIIYKRKIQPMVKQIIAKTMLNIVDSNKAHCNNFLYNEKQIIPQINLSD
jgi:15-cis-phytoene synthase